jgi:hypothetical protein
MEDELVEPLVAHWENRWYFFVPLALVGLWVVEVVAWGVLYFVAPDAESQVRLMGATGPTSGISLLLELGDWLGLVGWASLFILYFVLVSQKRASGWWALGGLCLGLNLPLYVVLLLRPPVRFARPALAPLPVRPFGWDESRQAEPLLKNSFACEACNALLNHGVSACSECGERYHYEDGKPFVLEP